MVEKIHHEVYCSLHGRVVIEAEGNPEYFKEFTCPFAHDFPGIDKVFIRADGEPLAEITMHPFNFNEEEETK